MEFHLTKKEAALEGQWLLPPPQGRTIRYEEPLHHGFLPKIARALETTRWPSQFWGYHYRLKTNRGLIHESTPASEYYKIAWRSMSQKYHGAAIALKSVEQNVYTIRSEYLSRRIAFGEQQQPSLSFSLELYQLRSDFATLLFLIRSILDQFASIVQFLSGPRAKQYSSFADLVSKCENGTSMAEVPSVVQVHLKNESSWFWRMRDIRDYLAHHGFVHLHLIETDEMDVRFFIHRRIDMVELAREFAAGFDGMLSILDSGYAARILESYEPR
ncbi:MAG TPA: hypothetical protein VM571_09790 [Noviherbaspirillum sp.]|jgi:hypothetical protein|nr:hypothetical protein [Noviherbaspirillum sp.]